MVASFFSLVLVVLLLGIFGLAQWWQIPVGNFADWVVGLASFGWLLTITTVPWNIYFEAKGALSEATLSAENGIAVDDRQIDYVRSLARWSLRLILGLHLLTALGLYLLSSTGVSQLGYWGSAAALLLSGLRPAVRTYQYFAARIAAIQQQFKYPHEDVVWLRDRLTQAETKLEELTTQLDTVDPASWAATEQRQRQALRQDLTVLATEVTTLVATNQAEHQRLALEGQQAIAQLSADGQFLEHVREIIRFFKAA
ncbi:MULTISPECIES: hypothetical protein [Cyanophyceae]|uniref:hypothetical protein n=1 Tax=Cyanophyceae TaxID=3028117 RepID=UPI00168A32CC|nr:MULTISPECIES: hypothetical protein [Cyanophyceae]MBD1915261.1 hypothetical protein [Phormidium sp. FACHB-77]MBD2032462.1 hypothetical protein [Phormidium sp. FACHB-322]MBD2051007.1 hypothetical protein [Leptolyngbya sp. FACHB-60]